MEPQAAAMTSVTMKLARARIQPRLLSRPRGRLARLLGNVEVLGDLTGGKLALEGLQPDEAVSRQAVLGKVVAEEVVVKLHGALAKRVRELEPGKRRVELPEVDPVVARVARGYAREYRDTAARARRLAGMLSDTSWLTSID